jgi:glycosyltransferase involved in cell wall biosynthesis
MKILHLSSRDTRGGAARAAYRLHRGLLSIDVASYMLVQTQDSRDQTIIGPSNDLEKILSKLRPRVDQLPLRLYPNRLRLPYSVQWTPSRIHSRIRELDPDIVNLHWTCEGFLSIGIIGQLDRPAIWTLHDMWPFTGGCHYDLGCDRYTQACGSCPQLCSQRKHDLSHWVWHHKTRAWQDTAITIVAVSQWLADCVRSSSLFKDRPIHVIPNGLNTGIFKPVDKKVARTLLNLPLDKPLILLGGMGNRQIKGLDLLPQVFLALNTSGWDTAEIVTFGTCQVEENDFQSPVHHLGFLHDDVSLVLAYAAVNVTVVPSVQEAFGQISSESLACGTPVVAFKTTGLEDIVDHQQNGYLAEPFQAKDLVRGITWILENKERYRELCRNARRKAVREFAQERQAERYVTLYRELLSRRSKKDSLNDTPNTNAPVDGYGGR